MQVRESTIRDGSLVSLKTTIAGLNVNYRRNVLEAEHIDANGQLQAKWETEKLVLDAAEHEAAKKARADARNAIASACVHSDFGLLCPVTNMDKLGECIAKANGIIEAFNNTAKLSRISVYVMTGKIENGDGQASRAIHSEVRDLLTEMVCGVASCDVKRIRDAANKAKNLSTMLSDEATAQLETAIECARDTAREIVKNGNAGALADEAASVIKTAEAYFA